METARREISQINPTTTELLFGSGQKINKANRYFTTGVTEPGLVLKGFINDDSSKFIYLGTLEKRSNFLGDYAALTESEFFLLDDRDEIVLSIAYNATNNSFKFYTTDLANHEANKKRLFDTIASLSGSEWILETRDSIKKFFEWKKARETAVVLTTPEAVSATTPTAPYEYNAASEEACYFSSSLATLPTSSPALGRQKTTTRIEEEKSRLSIEVDLCFDNDLAFNPYNKTARIIAEYKTECGVIENPCVFSYNEQEFAFYQDDENPNMSMFAILDDSGEKIVSLIRIDPENGKVKLYCESTFQIGKARDDYFSYLDKWALYENNVLQILSDRIINLKDSDSDTKAYIRKFCESYHRETAASSSASALAAAVGYGRRYGGGGGSSD